MTVIGLPKDMVTEEDVVEIVGEERAGELVKEEGAQQMSL